MAPTMEYMHTDIPAGMTAAQYRRIANPKRPSRTRRILSAIHARNETRTQKGW